MKKILIFIILSFTAVYIAEAQTKSFYDFTVETLSGEKFELSKLKGKKVMVVNTASKCGLTPQYETLEKLYKEYKSKGFVIIGFPANNFLNQEPGSNSEIGEFCTENYGVTFPMMAKISVKGKSIHPVYKWLTTKTENGVLDSDVSWNFQKFLVDENGKLVKSIPPREKPDSPEVISWITGK